MAKADKGARADKGAKADKPAKPDKSQRKRERKVVKLETQLADAREIRAAVDALITHLEGEIASLGPAAAPAQAAADPPVPPTAPARPRRRRTPPTAGS